MAHLTLPQYLLESSFALAVFYLFYHLLLRREACFQTNRFYLLGTALFSLLLPFLHVDIQPAVSEGSLLNYSILPAIQSAHGYHDSLLDAVETPSRFVLSVGDVIRIVYWVGVLLMSIKLIDGLLRLFSIISKGHKRKHGRETLVSGLTDVPASSFFSYIFWSDQVTEDESVKNAILQHELVHVRQWHSLDVIIMELMVIFKWFNPLIYLFRKQLRLTHEYIADRYVSGQMQDTYSYANILLTHSNTPAHSPLPNTFYAHLRQRIEMLRMDTKGTTFPLRILLAAPIAATLFALFSFDLSDRLPGVSSSIDQVESAYTDISQTPVIDIQKPAAQDSSNQDVDKVKIPDLLFRWGDITVSPMKPPREAFDTQYLNLKDFLRSVKQKPYFDGPSYNYKDFTFRMTITQDGKDPVSYDITADSDYDFNLDGVDLGPAQVHLQNVTYKDHNTKSTFSQVFEIGNQNSRRVTSIDLFQNDPLFDMADLDKPPSAYIQIGSEEVALYPFFFHNFYSKVKKEPKEQILEHLNQRNWTVDYRGQAIKLSDKAAINIEVYREEARFSNAQRNSSIVDTYMNQKRPKGVTSRIISNDFRMTAQVSEIYILDRSKRESRQVLEEWLNTLEDGDRITVSIAKADTGLDDEVTLKYLVSSGNEAYEPTVEFAKKNVGPTEESRFQLIYGLGQKTLAKFDTADPQNADLLKSFSNTDVYEIMDIPNFTTQYRIITYEDPLSQIPKESGSYQDHINEHLLKELDEKAESTKLHWGRMISMPGIGNFSHKEFLRSRKSGLRLYTSDGSDYPVVRFDIYLVDHEGKKQAFRAANTREPVLLKAISQLGPQSSVFFDNIIVDVDGENRWLIDRFRFVFE